MARLEVLKLMALALSLTVSTALGARGSNAGPPRQEPAGVFAEEFSGPDLDRSRWSVIVTGRAVNNERLRVQCK